MISTIRINEKEYYMLLNSLTEMEDKILNKMSSASDSMTYGALANLLAGTKKLYKKIERLRENESITD